MLNNPPGQRPWKMGLSRTADMIRLDIVDESSRTFMTNCSPILSGGGKPAGVLISFDDVTELEQKELEFANLQGRSRAGKPFQERVSG